METDWRQEREDVLAVFNMMLSIATGDGSKKRQAGEKPPWYEDQSHEAAIFSHLNKWKHGEDFDPDSGAHPLVHLAWRALAIAYQETYGTMSPRLCREGQVEEALSNPQEEAATAQRLAELQVAAENVLQALAKSYH